MAIAESDWKAFKKVRAKALERLSQKILDECQAICRDTSRTAHERYGDLYGLVQDRNREMAGAFDDFRRSTAVHCLVLMANHGWLEEADIAKFSQDIQVFLRKR